MMQREDRLVEYLESSFLQDLLKKKGVTDISYNGVALFYVSNTEGRKKYEGEVSSQEVGDFLRQIANYSEKQFSYLDPVLDVSFDKYRLSAMFLSLVRVNNRKAYSFSLRIASTESVLENDDGFFPGNTKEILLDALNKGKSIVIGGETGTGKTELQKFLLRHLEPCTRVIVIDNVQELELSRGDGELDLTSWVVDERNQKASFSALIRAALRNNPDYLLVAESRGGEMLDALSVVMAGHPIITTFHAKDIQAMPYRMARMAMMCEKKLEFDDLLSDIYHHFSVFVYLKKSYIHGKAYRRIESIGILKEATHTIEIMWEEGK